PEREIDIARPVARRWWGRIAALTNVSPVRPARLRDRLPPNLDFRRAGEKLLPPKDSVLRYIGGLRDWSKRWELSGPYFRACGQPRRVEFHARRGHRTPERPLFRAPHRDFQRQRHPRQGHPHVRAHLRWPSLLPGYTPPPTSH